MLWLRSQQIIEIFSAPSRGAAKPEDIAFYFTHWLTDLAGAEPFPLEAGSGRVEPRKPRGLRPRGRAFR